MATETKAVVVYADESPTVVVGAPPEKFEIGSLTINSSDPINKKGGYFENDFKPADPRISAFSRMRVKKLEPPRSWQELANAAQNNFYRPCPTASKTELSPCPVVVQMRVYPNGDCPEVSKIVEDGSLDFPIPTDLIPATGRVVISKAQLLSYKNAGLHYPARLQLIVNGELTLQPTTDVPDTLTNWDSKTRIPGIHIEPNQTDERLVSEASGNLGVCDPNKLAWHSRLAKLESLKPAMEELRKLGQWPEQKDKEVVEFLLVENDPEKTSITFLDWTIGQFWLYCWHALASHWQKQKLQVTDTVFPVPFEAVDGRKRTVHVPIYRPAVAKLLEVMNTVLRHSSSFELGKGIKLRLALDTQSEAYKNMVRARKTAEQKKLLQTLDKYMERCEACFAIQLELLTLKTPDLKPAMPAQQLADEDPDEEDDAILGLGLASVGFGGRVRPLRGTKGFK